MRRTLFICALAALACTGMTTRPGRTAASAPAVELLPGGGLESTAAGWAPFEAGFQLDRMVAHTGEQSARCTATEGNALLGIQTHIELNQTRPTPVLVEGWSRARGVGGSRNGDYSVYVDLEYTDGTPLWGQIAPFTVGTHDWERRQVLVLPTKPLRRMTVIGLFRKHAGTAWFDDFSARELGGARLWDSQDLPEPVPVASEQEAGRVRSGDGLSLGLTAMGTVRQVALAGRDISGVAAGGFLVRDVGHDGRALPVRGAVTPLAGGGLHLESGPGLTSFGLRADLQPGPNGVSVSGEVRALGAEDRALTMYFALPVQAVGWRWGQDIRSEPPVESDREYSNQTRVDLGATGGMSLYPFGCVAGPSGGVGIANGALTPTISRIFYSAGRRQLVIATDVALTALSGGKVGRSARFQFTVFPLTATEAPWGFRAAARRYQQLQPDAFRRRASAEGIWMPFTDPAKIQNASDFGIAYHEGDNSLKSDDERGILSFRYTEPMTHWLAMPPEMPRTYENALALLRKHAEGGKPAEQSAARATLNSGTRDPSGRFNLEFRNEPWANGAVFVLDPNPALPATPEQPTKASLSYTPEMADRMYRPDRPEGMQDGEYLDSLEGWADSQDYDPAHLAACPYPLPFTTDTRRPVLPQWYSTYDLTRFMSVDLHRRGKLLMANSTPVRFSVYAPLLDVMGIEVNWLWADGTWHPDADDVFNLRRTMCGSKPYLLLQNTNYERFTPKYVEKYFQRCAFYAVFPSVFSADAATHPYWEDPKLYNRDRSLFRKYIPVIRRLSASGWEPVTNARSSDPGVWVERYGAGLFTVFNPTPQARETRLTLEAPLPGKTTSASELFSGQNIRIEGTPGKSVVTLRLEPEACAVVEFK